MTEKETPEAFAARMKESPEAWAARMSRAELHDRLLAYADGVLPIAVASEVVARFIDMEAALLQFITAGQMYDEPDDWSPSSVDFDVCLRDARAAIAKARGSR